MAEKKTHQWARGFGGGRCVNEGCLARCGTVPVGDPCPRTEHWRVVSDLGPIGSVPTPEQVEQFTTKTSDRRAMMRLAEFYDRYTGGRITPESVGVTEGEAREILRKLTEAYPSMSQWVPPIL